MAALNGDGKPSDAKEEMDEVTKMLMKVPPNGELAERHSAANRVVDRATILVKEVKGGDNKCQCC